MSNREKVLRAAVTLFNQVGVADTSTNHIARAAGVSPGNLYFHFRNREEIVQHLFLQMAGEIEKLWQDSVAAQPAAEPVGFFRETLEISWRYRFFHREMYHLRRRDQVLARVWRRHTGQCMKLLGLLVQSWQQEGRIETGTAPRNAHSPQNPDVLCELLIMTLSQSLMFFESRERQPAREKINAALERSLAALGLPIGAESSFTQAD